MSVVIRIEDDGSIAVETSDGSGVKSFKQISPGSLLDCINKSVGRDGISTGILPRNCIAFTAYDGGERDVCMLHPESRSDVSYFGTEYKDFPLPRLVFGFRLSKEGRVSSCRLGVIDNTDTLKPETKMYHYPLSNVSGFHLCTGNNTFPKCDSLHTLTSLPYYIIGMPNNNDHFKSQNNKGGLEMRDLLELMKYKEQCYYYNNVLLPNGAVLSDFITGRSM